MPKTNRVERRETLPDTEQEITLRVMQADPTAGRDHPAARSPQEPTTSTDHDGKPVELTAAVIRDLAMGAEVGLFVDQYSVPFAQIPVSTPEPHIECLNVRSKVFLSRLLALIEEETSQTPEPREIKRAMEMFELQAHRSGQRELSNRTMVAAGVVHVDVGDAAWRMITVDQDGWKVEPQDEAHFFRVRHHKALPEPVPGGDPNELFEFVPVDEDHDRLLLLAWVISAFHPGVPGPILLWTGQQGSAKTTRCRRLRSLIDPSEAAMLGNIEIGNLFRIFHHHATPCFENVSQFDPKTTDMFCRAVTGSSVEQRRLYTDADQVLYSFRRAIMINGIDLPSTRPDFLDRCLIMNCKRMNNFLPLAGLDAAFEAARPRLLGSLLDLLVKTMRVVNGIPPTSGFRMADFAQFGRATAVALGKTIEEFDASYEANQRHQYDDVLDDSSFARVVADFAKGYDVEEPWKGSAEKLLHELVDWAKRKGQSHSDRSWPGSPRWASTRLSELAPVLASEGVLVERQPRTGNCRPWKLYSVDPTAGDTEAQPDDRE